MRRDLDGGKERDIAYLYVLLTVLKTNYALADWVRSDGSDRWIEKSSQEIQEALKAKGSGALVVLLVNQVSNAVARDMLSSAGSGDELQWLQQSIPGVIDYLKVVRV